MIKRIILLIICHLVLSNSFAQIESFDLSSFKLPNIRYQSLEVDFGAENQNQINKWTSDSDFFNKSSRFNTSGYLNGSYYQLINTPKQQSNYLIRTNFQIDPYNASRGSKNNELQDWLNSTTFYSNIIGNHQNRLYINDIVFVEIGSSLGFLNSSIKRHESIKDENENLLQELFTGYYSSLVNANTRAGFGYGRIEPVHDAQLALHILKDLKQLNRLKREPDHQEIFQLAETISQLRYKRVFDSRKRIISEVKIIDSLLTSLGLSDEMDATYFSTIYDNWLYANNPNRLSGYRIAVGPSIGYSTGKQISKWERNYFNPNSTIAGENETITNIFSYGLWLNALHDKPINHIWQRTTSVSLGYSTYLNRIIPNEEPELQMNRNRLNSYAAVTWGYYPNTRTYIDFGTNLNLNRIEGKREFSNTNNDNEELFKYHSLLLGAFVNSYYYLSPQLRLSFSSSLNYNLTGSDNYEFIDTPPYGWDGFLGLGGFSNINYNRLNFWFLLNFTYAII